MALIDVVKFEPRQGTDWIMYKFPGDEVHTKSKIIVGPGQRAIAVHGGKVEGEFKPGTTILSTEVYPFLNAFVKMVHGGKQPYTMEIYYFNTTVQTRSEWGTKRPALLTDPQTGLVVHARAFGSYNARLGDTQFFLSEFAGSVAGGDIVTYATVKEKLDGIIQQTIQKSLGDFMVKQKIGVLELPGYVEDFSHSLKDSCLEYFAKYGFEITDLVTESLNVPDEDMEALKKAREYQVLGTSYERNRQLDIQEKWAGNEGQAGGIAAAGMALGIGLNGINQFQANANNNAPVTGNPTAPNSATVCPKCGASVPDGSKFCPGCGEPVASKKFCVHCGKPVDANAKFCPHCGGKL